MIEEAAGWIAPVATTIAAMMTAANLGTRVTGWGFVVFLIGSLAWSAVGMSTGQANLLWTNGFLTLVNVVGVWRWLRRQAAYDDGGEAAAKRSATAKVPTLFAFGALIGSKIGDRDGEIIGTVVDVMGQCRGADIAYLVVSEGGVGGVGERLHAVAAERLTFKAEAVVANFNAADLHAMPTLDADNWPAKS